MIDQKRCNCKFKVFRNKNRTKTDDGTKNERVFVEILSLAITISSLKITGNS